jgi:hypothetical protein
MAWYLVKKAQGQLKPGGKRVLGGPRNRWEDNIRMDLKFKVSAYKLDSGGSGEGPVESHREHVRVTRNV